MAPTGFNGYDGPMFPSVCRSFSIYTHLATDGIGRDMGVQSPAQWWLQENLVVPIGYGGWYWIHSFLASSIVNFPDGLDLCLEDRRANITLLNANSDFTLTTTSSLNGAGRFYLHS
jgi:hypothetical protein